MEGDLLVNNRFFRDDQFLLVLNTLERNRLTDWSMTQQAGAAASRHALATKHVAAVAKEQVDASGCPVFVRRGLAAVANDDRRHDE